MARLVRAAVDTFGVGVALILLGAVILGLHP